MNIKPAYLITTLCILLLWFSFTSTRNSTTIMPEALQDSPQQEYSLSASPKPDTIDIRKAEEATVYKDMPYSTEDDTLQPIKNDKAQPPPKRDHDDSQREERYPTPSPAVRKKAFLPKSDFQLPPSNLELNFQQEESYTHEASTFQNELLNVLGNYQEEDNIEFIEIECRATVCLLVLRVYISGDLDAAKRAHSGPFHYINTHILQGRAYSLREKPFSGGLELTYFIQNSDYDKS